MRTSVFVFCLVYLLCISLVAAGKHAKLPSEYERCNVTSPTYSECILAATSQAFVSLRKGIPTLGVPPIDPLEITEIAMREGRGSAQFSLSLNNVLMYGLSELQLLSTSNEIPKGGVNMKADITIPRFQIISDYKIQGRILVLPIQGNGKSNFTLENLRITSFLENRLFEKDGEQFLEVMKFKPKVSAEKIHTKLDNLFNGNEQLGRQMNIFLNENSQEVFKDLAPALEEAFGEAFKQICNRIFLKVPFKTIF
ncbi:hypothetical protein B566_EDAN015252, partial [Ephemera danica]